MLRLKIFSMIAMRQAFKLLQLPSKGFSSLQMILIIMTLGIIMMKTFSHISTLWQKDYIQYKRYYQQFNQAQSSIEWAMTQQWTIPTEHWQCQELLTYQLSACIKVAGLLNGEYVIVKGEFQQFKLFHLATLYNGKLTLQQGHWLDYCPNNKSQYCE